MRNRPARTPHWRSIPDNVILALSRPGWARAESLCPSATTVEQAALGDLYAGAIIAEWAPHFVIITEAAHAN